MNRGRGKNSSDGSRGRNGDAKGKSSKGKETRSNSRTGKQGVSKSRDKGKYVDFKDKQRKGDTLPSFGEDVRLNKFLSNAGIASRREADVLIKTGVVSVNGEIITEMGYKVKPGDEVKYDGHTIKTATKRYVLLNKPKGFVTSLNDPFGRKNAYGLIQKACKEVVFPMGKMDKDAIGLVLYTNDSDLEKKMTHPKHKPSRLYHVELTRKMQPEDMEKLRSGVLLDDGTIRFDSADYVTGKEMYEIGLEVRSTKSQVVHRALQALGYNISKLDRVTFAGLTKKDLPRGHYRMLTEKEVAFLKMK
ncbi:MAG: pseudouridine synthase [Crocinitomicaceae bacterium]